MGACCTRTDQNEELNTLPNTNEQPVNKAKANAGIPTEESSYAYKVRFINNFSRPTILAIT